MTEFRKVAREFSRMCKHYINCCQCPIQEAKDELKMMNMGCAFFMGAYPEKSEKVIMKWAEKHPRFTNSEKFREVFGKDLFNLCTKEPWGDVVNWLDEEYNAQ